MNYTCVIFIRELLLYTDASSCAGISHSINPPLPGFPPSINLPGSCLDHRVHDIVRQTTQVVKISCDHHVSLQTPTGPPAAKTNLKQIKKYEYNEKQMINLLLFTKVTHINWIREFGRLVWDGMVAQLLHSYISVSVWKCARNDVLDHTIITRVS